LQADRLQVCGASACGFARSVHYVSDRRAFPDGSRIRACFMKRDPFIIRVKSERIGSASALDSQKQSVR
jgi:hypothetical protein